MSDFTNGAIIGFAVGFLLFTETGRSLTGLGSKAVQRGGQIVEKKYLSGGQ